MAPTTERTRTTVTRLPDLTDFNCQHPGCGAVKGFRCTYSGWSKGHPIRRQRLIAALDRRITLCKRPERRAAMISYRASLVDTGLVAA